MKYRYWNANASLKSLYVSKANMAAIFVRQNTRVYGVGYHTHRKDLVIRQTADSKCFAFVWFLPEVFSLLWILQYLPWKFRSSSQNLFSIYSFTFSLLSLRTSACSALVFNTKLPLIAVQSFVFLCLFGYETSECCSKT